VAIRHYNMGWQPTLSGKGAGLLSATPSGVTVLTIRPLEQGDAYLVRVHNSTSSDVSANIQFPAVQVQEAYLGSVMGERTAAVNWTPHSVTMPMGKYEIKSLVVKVAANK
jgi:Glycosyl hydrolases family 38 C-terminal beta sandwich domain